MRRWPAVKLAVSRTPRANGRIRRLIVSITTNTGVSAGGVLSGSRWANVCVGCVRSPIITVAIHTGTAKAMLNDSWVVGVNVYGSNPSKLIESKNIISDIIRSAQLWLFRLNGVNS